MVLDYAGAWIVDVVLKRALADVKPRESEFRISSVLLVGCCLFAY